MGKIVEILLTAVGAILQGAIIIAAGHRMIDVLTASIIR